MVFREQLYITHQVNTSNTVVAEYSFDAWGRRRNPFDWGYSLNDQPELFAGIGFTGHEHLPDFNLINMNGRLYDPLVGRFLSPDIVVQAPDHTQSYNRYSYCLNNPLNFNDPSGYLLYKRSADYGDDADYYAGIMRSFTSPGGCSMYYAMTGARVSNYDMGRTAGDNDVINYDWTTGKYVNRKGDEVSSEVADRHVQKNGIGIKNIIFIGTRENPYQSIVGFHFTNGTSYYYGNHLNQSTVAQDNFINEGLKVSGSINDFIDAGAKVLAADGMTSKIVNTGKTVGRYSLPTGLFISASQVAFAVIGTVIGRFWRSIWWCLWR